MLIRSQDKKRLADAIEIFVNTDIVTLKKIREIRVRVARQPLFGDNSIVFGKYLDEEAAVNEIDNITRFFIDNPTGIYQIR